MFSFPPLPVPPPVPGSSASAPVSSPTPFKNLFGHTVAGNNTVDASANGSGIDTSVGVGTVGAVAALEAIRVDSGRNVTTSSEPIVSEGDEPPSACTENPLTSGKRVQKVLADPEIPSKSNSTPPIRKTGRVRMETTRFTQANSIGQNPKRPRPAESQNERPKKSKCLVFSAFTLAHAPIYIGK